MRSMHNSNSISMPLRMHNHQDRHLLVIRRNQDPMTVTLRHVGEKTGAGDPLNLTYEEVDELVAHLHHVVHGSTFRLVPEVDVERHLGDLDEIDATLESP